MQGAETGECTRLLTHSSLDISRITGYTWKVNRRSDPVGRSAFCVTKGAFTVGYTREDIIRLVKEQDVKFIRMQFTDIFGQLKNVVITASQIEKALNNQIAFDGSSIEGFVRLEESDQFLYPDLDSFLIFPWDPEDNKVARLVCDVYNRDGSPFIGDPRGVLKRVLQKAEAMGFDTFNVGPEAEFFMFHTDENGKPTTETNDGERIAVTTRTGASCFSQILYRSFFG